jgi:GNAT superfamily N-acetyltransferase
MRFRFATHEDAEQLAPLNAQLIQDEGHRNRMTIPQLADRMRDWLRGEYRAVLFQEADIVMGYALFRSEPEHVYLRQLFIAPEYRRRGKGREAIAWLWKNAWADAKFLRVDVLSGNVAGQAFWRCVGFHDYCLTMEMKRPDIEDCLPIAAVHIAIRKAETEDLDTVADILHEAARWLQQKGMPLWRLDEIASPRIESDVAAGLFFLAECNREFAGTVKFQLEDVEHWPDVPRGEAAYLHRLAVRRQFAGQGVSSAILRWAVAQTASLGRRFLRLDCVADRPRLRTIYEGFGFRHHSDRQVGPYHIARYEYDVTSEG